MANMFITGGSGFIARHLATRLAGRGHRVTVMVRQPREFRREGRQPVEVVAGDLMRETRAFIPKDTDIVFHLAARSATLASLEDPVATFAVNALGTARLLEEIRRRDLDVRRFVQASTSQVYGHPERVPIPEDAATNALNPYAASKLGAEAYGLACHRLYGIPVTIVRPFNVYGPGQNENYVVPSFLSQCLFEDALKIGNPWPVRDFLFVDDATALLERMGTSPRAPGEVFNAGSGKGTSIIDMARLAAKVTRSGLAPKVDARRQRTTEFDLLVADVKKAKRLLGWSPTVKLAEGLSRTAESMRRRSK